MRSGFYKNILRDQNGNMAVEMSIAFPVFILLIFLCLDLARFTIAHRQFQNRAYVFTVLHDQQPQTWTEVSLKQSFQAFLSEGEREWIRLDSLVVHSIGEDRGFLLSHSTNATVLGTFFDLSPLLRGTVRFSHFKRQQD